MENTINYIINDKSFTFNFEGDFEKGENTILLDEDTNLLEKTSFNDVGYTIATFLNPDENQEFKAVVETIIKNLILNNGGTLDENFTLEKYHKYVDNDLQLKIAKDIKNGWKQSDFNFNLELINKRISAIIGQKVSTKAKDESINDYYLRIVRPNCLQDNNPPHRDVWLDRLRNAVNIYHPICGSTPDSALPILPGSHKFKESSLIRTAKGAVLNNTEYTVPCVIAVNDKPLKMIRPNPSENEVLVFSPYLVHGGGYNTNDDTTRISLEMRFWKVEE